MKKSLWLLAFLLPVAGAVTAYFYTVEYLAWNVPLYAAATAAVFLDGAAAFALLAKAKEKPKKGVLLSALSGGLIAAVGAFAVSFVINVLIYHERGNKQAAAAMAVFGFLFALFCVLRLKKITKERFVWKPLLAVVLCVCLLVCGLAPALPRLPDVLYERGFYAQADPAGLSVHTDDPLPPAEDADLYLAPDGDDGNDGSFEKPLATLEKARDLVRAMDRTGKDGIVVALKAGEYPLRHIEFTVEDGGAPGCPVVYRAYGDGEVILNGGVTLTASDFSAVTDETMRSRLPDGGENVVCADLTEFGLTADDWGELVPMCGHTADNYDDYVPGPPACELFVGDKQMTLARYPNDGNLRVVTIIQEGEGLESAASNHAQRADWDTLRNPQTTVFSVDKDTADRIHSYKSLDDVWIWEALIHEFAQSTVPLKSFDYENRAVEQKYVSRYGAVAGSAYRIFNVPEELDAPGEWYLDRDSGILYLYPDCDLQSAGITLTVSTEDLLTVTDADHLRFDGLTLKGSRGSGIVIRGSDITVSDCRVSEVSGFGVSAVGYRDTVLGCEIVNTGSSGVSIDGGDRPTLTSGENRVENNLVRGAGFLRSGHGISVSGVGAVVAHNEVCDSESTGIAYWGNNITVEYNVIHDTDLYTNDGGAIYTGRRWDCGGCVVRYNVMYRLGDENHTPNGVYFDDGVSGQTAYGNLIVNAKQNGFLIGGGRDHNVYNNILINCKTPVCYDDRSREAILEPSSWFQHSREGMDMQQNLEAMPWRGALWQKEYPYTAGWTLDYSDTETPNFIPNPANSKVGGNLIVQYEGSFGYADESVYRFSDLSGNAVYQLNQMKKLFVDFENGDYTLRDDAPVFDLIPDFEPIPLSEIGRY
ncbi:MAG: right-handed parallel beta-helix repeat-containing protein [Clostridia bacterium]|nr:right-handed parallel beta-helix repeat-containing protein [Clostridia bacterium]